MIYGVVFDIYVNNWSVFFFINSDGVNLCFCIIFNELLCVVQIVKVVGGKVLIVVGDILYICGLIDLEVFNLVCDIFKQIFVFGVSVYVILGNYDLKFKDSCEFLLVIQNFVEILFEGMEFCVFNELMVIVIGDQMFGFVFWCYM